MQYDEVISALLHRFPVLAPSYEKLVSRHRAINESPGAHVVFGDLFCDYLIENAKRGESDSDELKRVANWIEELAGSRDSEVRHLIEVSVLERLADERVDEILPFLGPNSATLVRHIGERLDLDPTTWGRI